MKPASGSPK
uniref:Uncharacterized protein n=1 Tax=Arundo donax TaxID=35708 RepID=A0A0A9HB41_ARUDO